MKAQFFSLHSLFCECAGGTVTCTAGAKSLLLFGRVFGRRKKRPLSFWSPRVQCPETNAFAETKFLFYHVEAACVCALSTCIYWSRGTLSPDTTHISETCTPERAAGAPGMRGSAAPPQEWLKCALHFEAQNQHTRVEQTFCSPPLLWRDNATWPAATSAPRADELIKRNLICRWRIQLQGPRWAAMNWKRV
jgi:hypothetical protein